MGSPLSPKTLRVAGQALGFTDEAGDAIRQLSRPIRAYHGSPHSFDAFDASKIGTGEGAQSYGHGLYFAGKEGTAKYYRDSLSGQVLVDGEPLTTPSVAERAWASMLSKDRDSADAQARAIRRRIASHSQRLAELQGRMDNKDMQMFEQPGLLTEYGTLKYLVGSLSDELRAYDSLSTRNVTRNPGHMYEVEIDYPEEALLDYDRPFSTPAGAAGAAVLRQDNPAAVSDSALRAIQDGSWRMESFAGRSPYETAAVELTRLARTRGGAQALKDAGIPGIRYLDGGSRSAGDGTRNYVIFPGAEDRIRILRKYGLLGPAAMAGTNSEEN